MKPDLYTRTVLVVVGFALITSGSGRYVHAQTMAAAPAARFDVAVVKPSGANEQMSQRVTPSGMWFASGVTLRFLLTLAWRVRDDQVTGGPSWLDNDRWDIAAKSESDPGLKDFQPMVQALLEDQFKLAVHETNREGPIYELVTAKKGPRLVATARSQDCTKNVDPPCGGFQFLERRHLIGKSVTMPVLALALARILQKTVADRTGIQGAWDMDVQWDPAQSDGPSIFTALEEQAGLRLQPGRGPVAVIVVDSAKRPTEN